MRRRGRSEPGVTRPFRYRFRLYVAGNALNSAQALANLTALCLTHLASRHEIEVVDVFIEAGRAAADGVFLTPTLIKLAPLPLRSIVGNLARTGEVLQALGLPAVPP
jgi:circadian clock protein KaiB